MLEVGTLMLVYNKVGVRMKSIGFQTDAVVVFLGFGVMKCLLGSWNDNVRKMLIRRA